MLQDRDERGAGDQRRSILTEGHFLGSFLAELFCYHLSQNYYIRAPYLLTINVGCSSVKIAVVPGPITVET